MSETTPKAVMASRRSGPEALDFFPTPPWATRALFEEVLKPNLAMRLGPAAWEPCCGAGHMAIPLKEYFPLVFASDVHDWGFGDRRDLDFTFAQAVDCPQPVDWIITNPPYALAERILDRALMIGPRTGIAFLLRLQWLEGGDRWRLIFRGDRKPAMVGVFADRVPMIERVWDPEATSATAYAWFVWHFPFSPMFTKIVHIAPGSSVRYARFSDAPLATRGEAARRRKAIRASAP